ncbi:cationic amino acid transporter 7, chloroplastic [Amborella trichopoda]|uniref:Cationic amino acid transporter C-terminal domain-containing protein n=1 Tax=Amborella trichopoda TaxID=13333 RepID=W1NTT3_AMBTC|nr:cationic amino acid transporter 7, chloroplastic [Amborella trichopoda]ERM98942.1 hypothetical protein AMTR_s00114p00137590 [Amborella trichopoda]|eukprot:XP_006836089.1 cationic amino acid transporter 7, chloroplastic [Amborella trichopoda]
MASHGSFSSLNSYIKALSETPQRLNKRMWSVSSASEELSLVKVRSGSLMAKRLRWFDLVGLGLGGMVGAGVFVTTGSAMKLYAGPGIVVSYAIAGLCALLSALCYTEFAVDMPVAGGAFSYLRITFGEFAAYMTGTNLVMEYVFSNAAVARSLTSYLGSAFGIVATEKWRIKIDSFPENYNSLDFVAVAIILALTFCICYSTKESSILNMAITGVHIVFIVFIIILGFCKGESENFTHTQNPSKEGGFFPYGATGVFNGAAIIYFSYIGYDAVSTMAEEVKDPAKDIPIGVSGSVVLVTVLYTLMAAAMAKLVPYDAIDLDSPFSSAFKRVVGWGWVSNVIGGGASLGILTSLMVAMLGQARYMCVIGRSAVVPTCFAKVHPRTSTPVNASIFLGLCTAAIAMFTDLSVLVNLISIGTLFVFYMVANAVLYRRYNAHEKGSVVPTLSFLAALSILSLLFALLWHQSPPLSNPIAVICRLLALTACPVTIVALLILFHNLVPQAPRPVLWAVPLMPYIPAVSVFLNIFLLASLDGASYLRFGVFSGVALMFYVLYSVHASYDHAEVRAREAGAVELMDVERESSNQGDSKV